MEIFSLFARPLAILNIDEIPEVEDIEDKVFKQAGWNQYSHIGEYSKDLKILSQFPELEKVITQKVQEYNDNVMNYKKNTVQLMSSWITRFKPGYKGNLHNHANCMYSIVFYPVSGGSTISFIDYSNKWQWDIRPEKQNSFNTQRLTITPERGMLLIFPAFADHTVDVNTDNKSRYSIVANYTIKGPVGFEDTKWFVDGHATE